MKALPLPNHRPKGRRGALVLLCAALTMGFSPQLGREVAGQLLIETDLYRVTASSKENWCFSRGRDDWQANINITWRVTAQEDLGGKSAGYQHQLADIWSGVTKQCPLSAAHISNYVSGVRLLGYGNDETGDVLSLKDFQYEVPLNTMMVSKTSSGKFEVRMGGEILDIGAWTRHGRHANRQRL